MIVISTDKCMRRLGVHTSIAGGLHLSLERAHALGCDTLQIFSHNPRGWYVKPLSEEDISRFRSLRTQLNISPVYIHTSYLINDSKGAAGSGLDRHEHIGCGKIGVKGLKQFINNPAFKAVPLVLETPKKEETDDPANIDRVRKMMNAQ